MPFDAPVIRAVLPARGDMVVPYLTNAVNSRLPTRHMYTTTTFQAAQGLADYSRPSYSDCNAQRYSNAFRGVYYLQLWLLDGGMSGDVPWTRFAASPRTQPRHN